MKSFKLQYERTLCVATFNKVEDENEMNSVFEPRTGRKRRGADKLLG